jgi:hypothetical protein
MDLDSIAEIVTLSGIIEEKVKDFGEYLSNFILKF